MNRNTAVFKREWIKAGKQLSIRAAVRRGSSMIHRCLGCGKRARWAATPARRDASIEESRVTDGDSLRRRPGVVPHQTIFLAGMNNCLKAPAHFSSRMPWCFKAAARLRRKIPRDWSKAAGLSALWALIRRNSSAELQLFHKIEGSGQDMPAFGCRDLPEGVVRVDGPSHAR